MCPALFHQLGTTTVLPLQMRKLRLGKERPFHFGGLSSHVTHTRAELYECISSCAHSSPHLHPQTHTGLHIPQPDTRALTYRTAHFHTCVHGNMCVPVGYIHIYTHVHTGLTLLDIHLRVRRGARIKGKSPTLASSLHPESAICCWQVRTGPGGASTGGYGLKGQR